MNVEILACPITKLSLAVTTLAQAREALCVNQLAHRPQQLGFNASPFGETEQVLLRSDHKAAYPIVDGIAVLLAPEVLTLPEEQLSFDLHLPQYEEAYEEMDFYNAAGQARANALKSAGSLDGQKGFGIQQLNRLQKLPPDKRGAFPNPHENWLATRADVAAELQCYEHLAPMDGKQMLQIGGDGEILLRFILAGAAKGILVTPMIGEAYSAMEIAKLLGVSDRLQCVIGVAEELPFANSSFDGCFSGACVHHMETTLAFPEINRILHPGGRFSAFDPWRAPLHDFGTKLFGKREVDVHCRPMDPERLRPLFTAFSEGRGVLHGTIARYPLVVLSDKLHMPLSLSWAKRIATWDNRICDLIPGSRRFGSSLAMLATKAN